VGAGTVRTDHKARACKRAGGWAPPALAGCPLHPFTRSPGPAPQTPTCPYDSWQPHASAVVPLANGSGTDWQGVVPLLPVQANASGTAVVEALGLYSGMSASGQAAAVGKMTAANRGAGCCC
jgi:hypothetical protein